MHYAQGWFEGGSVRPIVEDGQVKAVNIVFEGLKNERYFKSAAALGFYRLTGNS
jgi:hypothetical protein